MVNRELALPAKHSFFLFGPRLTGKSTLLEKTFHRPDTLFVDLLDTANYERYLAEPGSLAREIKALKKTPRRIVLDEIQRVPALLTEVHRLMEGAGRNIQFVMSGSSARKLKRAEADMLAGRAWNLELHPLTLKELGNNFNMERALSYGALPKVWDQAGPEARQTLRAYVETYLAEEIRAEALVRQLGTFFRFLPLAAHENGHILNFSTLAREAGTTYKTIQEYYQILADTLIGFWLPAYAKSQRSRMVKHPKFYFFDTGVVRAMTKTLASPLDSRGPDFGRLYENWVIGEIRRRNSYERKDWSLSFYRTEAGAEVDLIVERPGDHPLAVEIKATLRPSTSDCSGLLSFAEVAPRADLYLVCTVERPQRFDFGGASVTALSWHDFFEKLKGS